MAKRTLAPVPSQPEVQEQPPPVLPKKMLKVGEVMDLFGLSRGEISSLMKRGMPHYKLGQKQRNLRFIEEELAIWLQGQRMTP